MANLSLFTWLYLGWIVLQTGRGYRRGVIMTLLGFAGFVGAYALSVVAGYPLAHQFTGVGMPPLYAYGLAFPVCFFAASFLLVQLPKRLFPSLLNVSKTSALWGALSGGVIGCVSGLMLIWFANFMLTSFHLMNQDADKPSPAVAQATSLPHASAQSHKPLALTSDAQQEVVSELANHLMGQLVGAGARVMDLPPEHVLLTQVVASSPAKVTVSLRQLMGSEYLPQLLRSEKTQRMMANNDVNGLMASAPFRALMSEPSSQVLLQLLAQQGAVDDNERVQDTNNSVQAEYFVAQKLTFVWRRLTYLRHDPRVKELLTDPEVKALFAGKNPLLMMANKKVQQLLAIVMEGQDNYSSAELERMMVSHFSAPELVHPEHESPAVPNTADTGSGEPRGSASSAQKTITNSAPVYKYKPYKPQPVYKWVDEKGRTQYGDIDAIPADRLDSAIKLMR